jgi:tRNA modification GTPase
MYQYLDLQDTIVALATPPGMGAIAVLRLSGSNAFALLQTCFSKNLEKVASHTMHLGNIRDEKGEIVDQVLVGLFRNPHSYTGEDVVELSCHGSVYIQEQLLQLFLRKGARLAKEGEFTLRAFMNGKLDLVQAEAVADLIHAESKAAHQLALQQMRGGFSQDLARLRQQLIEFAALIELELDFGEEDVEFADRRQLKALVAEVLARIEALVESFELGNVLKNGLPIAIVGKPNAGKSTLLNALLNEEKAIVSPIAGTTRDVIEDSIYLGGVRFRFMDTAGLRETEDLIEQIGVQRAKQKIQEAKLLLYVFDAQELQTAEEVQEIAAQAASFGIPYLLLANKMDLANPQVAAALQAPIIPLVAKTKQGLDALKTALLERAKQPSMGQELILTNARHVEALRQAAQHLQTVLSHLDQGVTGDFLALDIRHALRHLGEITGAIDVDEDILGTIFGKFCIGK